MRITQEQISLAVQIIRNRFPDASVWLFGSRVDDAKRGGDFDFYVETGRADNIAVDKALTRGDLNDALGISTDLVVNNHRHDRPIYTIARQTGVRLA